MQPPTTQDQTLVALSLWAIFNCVCYHGQAHTNQIKFSNCLRECARNAVCGFTAPPGAVSGAGPCGPDAGRPGTHDTHLVSCSSVCMYFTLVKYVQYTCVVSRLTSHVSVPRSGRSAFVVRVHGLRPVWGERDARCTCGARVTV
eukprot:scaffold22772_cov75-Phaeocystis_antarctica.AAC.2